MATINTEGQIKLKLNLVLSLLNAYQATNTSSCNSCLSANTCLEAYKKLFTTIAISGFTKTYRTSSVRLKELGPIFLGKDLALS